MRRLILLPVLVASSPFDPHAYATRAPFFEGWFARLVDPERNVSVGVITGTWRARGAAAAGAFERQTFAAAIVDHPLNITHDDGASVSFPNS